MIETRIRNVTVNGHRTSVRLEEAFWSALDEILGRDGHLNELVSHIAAAQGSDGNLSSAIRVFTCSYFIGLARQDASAIALKDVSEGTA